VANGSDERQGVTLNTLPDLGSEASGAEKKALSFHAFANCFPRLCERTGALKVEVYPWDDQFFK
jgi:hypothetical protein